MKIYELKIEDENTDEVFALSLVENPAIEADWVFFSKDGEKEEVKFATVDTDKRLIVAPVLIPDKKILRIDEKSGEEYRVFFTPETVEKLAQNYIKNGYQDKATIEHSKNIDGKVTVVESWVSKSSTKDKSALYFNRAFPIGTWFITMKVNDENLWQNYVKTGIIRAISLEGIFSHQLVKQSKVQSLLSKDINDLTEEEATIFLSKIIAMFESYSDYGTDIKNNAKRGIELNEKNGNKCATQTGKVRAQQLADGEPISVDTIKRMYSYLSRAEVYYDETDTTACGTISYLLWGGKSALSWSRSKLDELGLLEAEAQPSVTSTYPGEAAIDEKKKQKMEIEAPNVNVFGYHTRYFGMCPGAQSLFEHLITMPVNEETIGMIRSAAQVADNVFRKEKEVIEAGVASEHDYEEAVLLVEDFKDIMNEIDEEVGMAHDVSFMDGHIEKIKKYK